MAWISDGVEEVIMDFYIQTSNPCIINEISMYDYKLSDAIESVFPMITEDLILFWDHIGIALSYKYDISYMIEDILMLLQRIQSEKKGEELIFWLPDTFRVDWRLVWNEEMIFIDANWVNITGGLQRILVDSRKIEISKKEFLSEWKMPLEVLINALEKSGYHWLMKQEYDKLVKSFNAIEKYGVLYQYREGN